jgi:hypothetical protein
VTSGSRIGAADRIIDTRRAPLRRWARAGQWVAAKAAVRRALYVTCAPPDLRPRTGGPAVRQAGLVKAEPGADAA